MKKVIIPQKQSGTGCIHDIASDMYDREIKFPKGHLYAVVLASYYGGKGYTTHASEQAAIQAHKRQKDYSREIVGVDGYIYQVDMSSSFDGELERDLHQRGHYKIQDFEQETAAAAVLGSIRSSKKAQTVRENGRKGGRPRKTK